jgi:hypothetical protein
MSQQTTLVLNSVVQTFYHHVFVFAFLYRLVVAIIELQSSESFENTYLFKGMCILQSL